LEPLEPDDERPLVELPLAAGPPPDESFDFAVVVDGVGASLADRSPDPDVACEPSADFDASPLGLVGALFDPDEPRRSTFAQPEPLNTMAGEEKAFRIEPSAPQFGQNFGPESLIPCTTSVT
jgi:hypothetical protein